MEHRDLTKLLRLQSAELTDKTPFCPEDQQIAEYFDEVLPHPEQARLEHHLADCRYCRARTGILERLAESGGSRRVSEAALAEAKRLGRAQTARKPVRAPTWAAAAVVVLALFSATKFGEVTGPVPGAPDHPTAGDSRQLRNIKPVTNRLEVLTPRPGQTLGLDERVEWLEVPGKLHYDLYVLSDAGDVLWNQRLDSHVWEFDAALGLVSGKQYYLRIEAPLSDGRYVRSRHIAFQVSER